MSIGIDSELVHTGITSLALSIYECYLHDCHSRSESDSENMGDFRIDDVTTANKAQHKPEHMSWIVLDVSGEHLSITNIFQHDAERLWVPGVKKDFKYFFELPPEQRPGIIIQKSKLDCMLNKYILLMHGINFESFA